MNMEHFKEEYEAIANEILAVLMNPESFASFNETINDYNAFGIKYIVKLVNDKSPELMDCVYDKYRFVGKSELEVIGKVARYVYQHTTIKKNGELYEVVMPDVLNQSNWHPKE
ncbi:hypothetical protein [Pediococcus acidilactici]|uniref:hypothetical protein n=2 Tax=Pediococcus acidilactici TaxID=1254 RepID=UPI0013254FDF|nr:hypothetical protein [Pediococcus acidilactici]KAF0365208.1 hypothetical protein GBO50_00655 [Pediococcus acidilactici]KAF0369286.1 hypothetical protein GBO55_00655 [Pediococcus acidilactici]KAF0417779.1 hypothetical protein GBO80_07655 [Pediococcus acidilactici]KAF0420967.1 hypothetical protein GBO82_07130 [Pediococcus acidilactici]KAF0474948.1 hypothetical protein GBP08_00655 [Pediococcus acidilactici]